MNRKNEGASLINFYCVFRCTTEQYADSFLNKGQIKFSTPDSWVKYAQNKATGRGDVLEGTMATYHISDIDKMKELNYKYIKYSELERMLINQRVYLKSSRDMHLPCFCFYILKENMFDWPDKTGKHKISARIPSSYFRDFMDELDPKDIDKLDQKNKPAVIIIHNYEEFNRRIINTLMSIGLTREEILIRPVTYLDFYKYGEYGWWDFEMKPPLELSIKHSRFINQSEARIIINTEDEKIKQILENPIEIGSLKDIAIVSNNYFYEGIDIELTVNIEPMN